jgi:hypothetical protein
VNSDDAEYLEQVKLTYSDTSQKMFYPVVMWLHTYAKNSELYTHDLRILLIERSKRIGKQKRRGWKRREKSLW